MLLSDAQRRVVVLMRWWVAFARERDWKARVDGIPRGRRNCGIVTGAIAVRVVGGDMLEVELMALRSWNFFPAG